MKNNYSSPSGLFGLPKLAYRGAHDTSSVVFACVGFCRSM